MDFRVTSSLRISCVLVLDFVPFYRFNGTAGLAIVSKTAAYLITDSRYWVQAANQLDNNWTLVKAGHVDHCKDWIEYLVKRAKDARIGVDARMLSCSKVAELNKKLLPRASKLVFPPQNLVDLVWVDKPQKSKEPIFIHPFEFTGKTAQDKLADVRSWIKDKPPATSPYSKSVPTPDKYHTATIITALDDIGKYLHQCAPGLELSVW